MCVTVSVYVTESLHVCVTEGLHVCVTVCASECDWVCGCVRARKCSGEDLSE